MRVVAVSQRVDVHPDRNERRDALDQRLISLLLKVGCMPVPVPNGLHLAAGAGMPVRDSFNTWIAAISPQAIVLSGGNDIGDCPERDSVENWLLDYAESSSLPALGICRGMQMMGLRAGAELKIIEGHVRTEHQLTGVINGKVNSYHNHALTTCPHKFTVLAQSEDAQIEAIRHESLPWEGWMWHPEREPVFSLRDVDRIRALFA